MATKNLDTCSKDAISSLSDELLGKILSLLPTKLAASTSVLSKKWRNVFRLVDNLNFVSREYQPERDTEYVRPWRVFPESFKNFVDRTLALQCDYPIKKFSLKCHVDKKNDYQKACVSRWICNVVERGVLELDLRIRDRDDVHSMPPQLFASKTLVKLTLGTRLNLGELPSYVSLPSLKTLFIDTVFVEDEELCGVLLAGCPVLEELSVRHNEFEGTPLAISSPTVKTLSIDHQYDDTDELSLNMPNLVYLNYSGFALRKYPQVNLESLVEAKLDLHWVGGTGWRPDVTNLFLGTRNVEILHLSPVSVNVISRCFSRRWLLLPVFNKLVKLSFGSKNERGWTLLLNLLKQTPKLETLIIQDLNGYTCADASMPLLNQVKVLHILGYRGTGEELKQLKSFLGKFQCLEVVQVEIAQYVVMDLQIKRELMMLPGVSVSSNCQIKVT